MIPLAIPNLSGNEARYLQECVETEFVSTVGPFVEKLEQMVAECSGNKGAVATSAGTTGLHLALISVGVKPDDLVIMPTLTFIASANAISQCCAEPWLFDVSRESWTLDPQLLRETLKKEAYKTDSGVFNKITGKRIGAVLPVYTLGQPADMDPIVEIAHEWGLPVVADAAAALGARYHDRPVGQFGADLNVYSFNGNKTVTSGGGGAISGDDETLLTLAKHLSTTARLGPGYHHDQVGFNYRMTNIEAAVGCAQLEQLEKFVTAKRSIANRYDRELVNLQSIAHFPNPDWADSACWLSGVLLDSSETTQDLMKNLNENGVDARPFWKPIHLQPPYKSCLRTSMAICEDIWDRVLTLPCSTNLTNEEQTKVIDLVQCAVS